MTSEGKQDLKEMSLSTTSPNNLTEPIYLEMGKSMHPFHLFLGGTQRDFNNQ